MALVLGLTGALATACGGGGGSGGSGSPTPTPAATATPAASATSGATPTAAPTAAATPTPTAGGEVSFDTLTGAPVGLVTTSAARNTLWSCTIDEISQDTLKQAWWNVETGVIDLAAAPRVPGSVQHDAQSSETIEGDERVLWSNGLPTHPTGEFPAPTDSEAYEVDPIGVEFSIEEQDFTVRVPASPEVAASASCIRGEMGLVTTTGAALFIGLDADGSAAAGTHPLDDCLGHIQSDGVYHYHSNSPCFDQGNPGEHAPLIGYVFDGFGIYGPRDEGGTIITNAELDECHGHTGPAPNADGETVTTYHYHLNNEFPFGVGCFRGTPIQTMVDPVGGGAQVALAHVPKHEAHCSSLPLSEIGRTPCH